MRVGERACAGNQSGGASGAVSVASRITFGWVIKYIQEGVIDTCRTLADHSHALHEFGLVVLVESECGVDDVCCVQAAA